MTAPNVEMTLLDNCISFIEEGLQKSIVAENNPKELKFSIFCLSQAVELALKELLRREHRVLVYSDIDKQTRTVTIEQALFRLKRIKSVDIDANDLDAIRNIGQIRNEIVHYSFEISPKETKLRLARILGFLTHFCRTQLQVDLTESIDESLWLQTIEIEKFENELTKRAEERYKRENIDTSWNWDCPKCNHDAFVHYNDINECYLCGHKEKTITCQGCGCEFLESETTKIDEGNMKKMKWIVHYCRDCLEKRDIDNNDDELLFR